MNHVLRRLVLTLCLATPGVPVLGASQKLPALGDASSGIVSLETERRIGQQFLRQLRGRVPTLADPLVKEYLELLIYRLAEHSELQDRRIDVVVIDSPQLNAFAAPGGIVGVNRGIFLYAQTEHELAGILAHELAHLSQRHFARGADYNRTSALVNLAGLLASVVIAATVGADVGLAALSTTQGANQANALRHSRNRETEADRVGINTMIKADMDPRAMAYMFERLSQINRLAGSRVPEFLLTHPVTRVRIADSYNQTNSLPKKDWPRRLDFELMRTRIQVHHETSPVRAEAVMRDKLAQNDQVERTAATYGIALALIRQRQTDRALTYVRSLRREFPNKIAFIIAEAEALVARESYEQAGELLADALALSPNNHPLAMVYAETMIKARRPADAEAQLIAQSQRRPGDADVWYLLAETYGLSENITGVHQARAEYFALTGNLEQAIKQLNFAIPLVRNNFTLNARITRRIEEFEALRDDG